MLILSNLTYHQSKTVGKAVAPLLIFLDVMFLVTAFSLIAAGKIMGVDIVLLLLALFLWSTLYHEVKTYSGYYELNEQGTPIRFLAPAISINQRPVNRSRFFYSIK